jgi:conjugal transfer pilus assembly protein TraI
MRLAPKVREVLAAAIDTMNGEAKLATAVTVPTGVFVPLEHFKKAGVEVPVALRSLGELEMVLADKSGKPQTLQHDLAGREVHGVVLKPRFVDGLDPSLFRPA